MALVALTMFAVWSPSLRDWTRRRVSAVTIGFIALQYAVLLFYNRGDADWISWATTLPWMMLGLRMAAAELVLLRW